MESTNIFDLLGAKSSINSKADQLLKADADSQLPVEEVLLRGYGLKDEKGEFTTIALELVMQKLVRDHQAYLLNLVTEQEKKNK